MLRFDRRRFLKRAGLAIGTGLSGCATTGNARSKESAHQGSLKVRVDAPTDHLVTRSFAILHDRISERCSTEVVEARKNANLILALDTNLPNEAFRIDNAGASIRVSGGSSRGLLYGIGKFLRTSGYEGTFQPSAWRGISEPHGTLRGMYFASHFHNWCQQAPEPEVRRYLEDLALWGMNSIMVIYPMINLHGWDDPEAEPAMAMLRRYATIAKELGLQFTTAVNNTMFIGAPQEIRATRLTDPMHRRGNSGHPICPSNPDGHAYLMANARTLYEKLSDIGVDIVCFWPYDEGGCACDQCRPWGSNAYLKLSREFAELGRTFYPNLKTVLSTWMFDTPPEGEWQGLTNYMASDGKWIDYILADAHEDFPRYPLDVGVPGARPLLNFPEISMWGNWPWGGFGANPLPARYQRLWDQVKHVVDGGFPYSEGIYEDMNKAVVLQFYWDPNRTARETLTEYINYEFGSGATDDVLAMVDLFEDTAGRSYQKQPVDTAAVHRAYDLAESVNSRLPAWGKANWRWEILHLRAILDRERFAGAGLETPAAETALLRLIELYHCQIETDDPYHHRVRPPLKRAISKSGQK